MHAWTHTNVQWISQNILDGGTLCHRLPLSRGDTYGDICQQYVRYISKHYGTPFVVFDGYLASPSTKDGVHRKRSVTYVGATVQVSRSMVFMGTREDFRLNKENKQGCHTEQSAADADLLIVQTAIAASENVSKPTVLVGKDTYLLASTPNSHLETYTFDQSQTMGKTSTQVLEH